MDQEFPPTDDSIGNPEQFAALGMPDTYGWIHASEIVSFADDDGGEPCLYRTIDPSDINQGLLGDCYFLSALAALAEWPDRVKGLFVNDDDGAFLEDFYTVNYCNVGRDEYINVDNYFPCDTEDHCPIFSHAATDNELWVLVLEKAYAKMHGSYANLEGGNAGEVLTDITGAPSTTLDLSEQNKEELWAKILTWERNGFPMCCGVPEGTTGAAKGPDSDLNEFGLAESHAYALMSAREARGERILKIRNPWSNGEWNGRWSDKWDGWNDKDLCRELDFQRVDDGVFWISFDDFMANFDEIIVHYFRDEWVLTWLDLGFGDASSVVTAIHVEEKSPVFIRVSQTDRRGRGDDYEYVHSNIVVYSKKSGRVAAQSESFVADRDHVIKATLAAGEYCVVVQVMGPTHDRDLVLATYSAKDVDIYSYEDGTTIADIMLDGWVKRSKKEGEVTELDGGSATVASMTMAEGSELIAIKNSDAAKALTLTLELEAGGMLTYRRDGGEGAAIRPLGPAELAGGEMEIRLNPGDACAICAVTDPNADEYSWSWSYGWEWGAAAVGRDQPVDGGDDGEYSYDGGDYDDDDYSAYSWDEDVTNW